MANHLFIQNTKLFHSHNNFVGILSQQEIQLETNAFYSFKNSFPLNIDNEILNDILTHSSENLTYTHYKSTTPLNQQRKLNFKTTSNFKNIPELTIRIYIVNILNIRTNTFSSKWLEKEIR